MYVFPLSILRMQALTRQGNLHFLQVQDGPNDKINSLIITVYILLSFSLRSIGLILKIMLSI